MRVERGTSVATLKPSNGEGLGQTLSHAELSDFVENCGGFRDFSKHSPSETTPLVGEPKCAPLLSFVPTATYIAQAINASNREIRRELVRQLKSPLRLG